MGSCIIEKLGYNVYKAGDGAEAIKIYEENSNKIDLILLDMIMPNMDSMDVYKHLKEINPNVRVLLASGYSINGKASEMLKQGCNGFIQKPYNIKELSQKIESILADLSSNK